MPAPSITPQMAREADAACVFTNLSTCAEAATRLFDGALQPAGISVEQLGYLVCIHGLPTINVDQLATRKALDPSSVRAGLARMHFRGWLRLPDRDDRPLELTGDGMAKLDEGAGLWAEVQERIVAAVGGEEPWERMLSDFGTIFTAIRSAQ